MFSDTKIYFRKGPRPDSCGFWFLNYITDTAMEVVFTGVVVEEYKPYMKGFIVYQAGLHYA